MYRVGDLASFECVDYCSTLHLGPRAVRTNIEIDDKLLAEAIKATGARTKREAVELGLASIVKLKRQERIRNYRGKLRWEGDLEDMRRDP